MTTQSKRPRPGSINEKTYMFIESHDKDGNHKWRAQECYDAYLKQFRGCYSGKDTMNEREIECRKWFLSCYQYMKGIDITNPYDHICVDGKIRPLEIRNSRKIFDHIEEHLGYEKAKFEWDCYKKGKGKGNGDGIWLAVKFYLFGNGKVKSKNNPLATCNCGWCGEEHKYIDVGRSGPSEVVTCPVNNMQGKVDKREINGSCAYLNSRVHKKRFEESEIALMVKYIEIGIKCPSCGPSVFWSQITHDHKDSNKKGKVKDPDNIQPMCSKCNSIKGKWENTNLGGFVQLEIPYELRVQDLIEHIKYKKLIKRSHALIKGVIPEFRKGETAAAKKLLQWYEDHKHLRGQNEDMQLVRDTDKRTT